MGVPKFFRYISERYPCLSELVKDYQIPEFDNLYLDMNGIIHNCSHPNDDDPHFRITEEKIFKDIFHYIEILFRMIKPQKLFFMAIDGVAPRAKMNQQRGRRFRSAADAAKAEADALNKGEQLPTEARFDSNCITPGTVFMAKLHEQLKYFVIDKISNDPLWQKCKVILSGHETPGEGEHKIMDYIRYMRVQPGYDPNTRHCLYGLDADLIMLGLCTHEPHFSLLREEVKFGRKNTKRITVPEEITFFLLHLSLLREYLELEFTPIKYNLRNFEYDFEHIIDDWVLMGFLVGNDFIPHLPNLHINEGALPILYKTYMEILPTLDGYINDEGKLNLKRFEVFMQKLGEQDLVNFEEVRDDMMFFESKRRCGNLKDLEEFALDGADDGIGFESLEPTPVSKTTKDSRLEALLRSADELCLDSEIDDCTDSDEEFTIFKKNYYMDKLEYPDVTPEVLRSQAEGYVTAIQWNLNYYYNGCCSWSWFYPHHYAPYISDIKGFTDFNIEFDLGKPFHPYEQLLGVLPAASKQLLPECYHDLMTDEKSLIIDFYPEKFDCDLNGKKQAWEAVVKIPFIDENLLLEAMSYCNDKLTSEEKRRNSHGPMLIYSYTPRNNGPYPSPCYFPEVPKNHTELKTMTYNDILVSKEKLIKGAYPGAIMDTYYPGFPTMKHLQYRGEIKMAHVKVFEQPSRNESMIIKIIPDVNLAGDMVPVDLLGTSVFIGWPHLVEAKVVAILNRNKKFVNMGGPGQYNAVDLKEGDLKDFHLSISGTSEHYKSRMGIEFGETKVLVQVRQLIGKKFTFNPKGKLLLEKQYAQNISSFPLQTIVFNINAYDPLKNVVKDVESVFPKNSICFTLTNPYYGSQGVIQDSAQVTKTGRIKISVSVLEEPDLSRIKDLYANEFKKYKPSHYVASPLCISNVLFSKITGSFFVKIGPGSEAKRINIGLDLKLNKKNKETPGYTKKVNNCWFYTEKTAGLVGEYIDKFPEALDYLSRNSDEDLTIENLFPVNSEEKFIELKKWLKSLPTESIEKTPCNSEVLDPDIILELEKLIDSFKIENVKKVTMQVKPNFLYRPEVQTSTLEPDIKTRTEILDRIVNVRHGYTVPFGFKGTVTGIRNYTANDRDTMYEVVFDKPFRDGMKLNCSDNRGYMLPKTAFINISYGQRLMVEKTGKPDELIADALSANSKQNDNQNNYFNNLIRPQPYFHQQRQPQQQWNLPQSSHLYPSQTRPPINQLNSAFAHFTSNNDQRRPYIPPPLQTKEQNSVQQFFNNHLLKEQQPSRENNVEVDSKWRKNEGNSIGQLFNNRLNKEINVDTIKLNKEIKEEQETTTVKDTKEYFKKQHETVSSDSFKKREESFKPRDDVNSFMPNFQTDNKTVSKDENSKNSGNPKQSNIPKPDSNSKARNVTVNTDFLKNILGIGKTEKASDQDETDKKENKSKQGVSSLNVSFDMLAQVAKTPASVRLLTYYQSNQLGLPRYQYFPDDDNKMVQAQITLNDGKIIIGDPAANREEASEKVATIVLDTLLKKYEKSVSPQRPKEGSKSSKNEITPSAVLNNSFVPLQVLKSHSKSISSNAIQNENVSKNFSSGQTADVQKHGNSKKSTQIEKAMAENQKPKKERRTRIAANFLNKN